MDSFERDCMTCGTIGCGHDDARRCGSMHAEWTPKKPAEKALTEDGVRRIVREELKAYATIDHVADRFRSYDRSWD